MLHEVNNILEMTHWQGLQGIGFNVFKFSYNYKLLELERPVPPVVCVCVQRSFTQTHPNAGLQSESDVRHN